MGRNTKVKRKPSIATINKAMAKVDAAGKAAAATFMADVGLTKVPEGKKLDSGKSPVTRGVLWYFPRALLAVADVSAYGCKKYDLALENKNWMKVPGGQGRYADAQGRHLIKQAINPTDKESELRHAQMDAWNSLAKLELLLVEEEKAGTVSYD